MVLVQTATERLAETRYKATLVDGVDVLHL